MRTTRYGATQDCCAPIGVSATLVVTAVALLACPFCREMHSASEFSARGPKMCPVCNMELEPLAKLPLSHDAAALDPTPNLPEREVLPITYLGRGKGVLLALALVGLFLFFQPWIAVTLPEEKYLLGFHLARKQGWPWAAFTGWFVLLPTVLSRRSVVKMQGARVACAFLSLMPFATALMFLIKRQGKIALLTIRFEYTWAVWATLVCGLVGVLVSLFLLGGKRTAAAVSGQTQTLAQRHINRVQTGESPVISERAVPGDPEPSLEEFLDPDARERPRGQTLH
jgi:hypothetical protein